MTDRYIAGKIKDIDGKLIIIRNNQEFLEIVKPVTNYLCVFKSKKVSFFCHITNIKLDKDIDVPIAKFPEPIVATPFGSINSSPFNTASSNPFKISEPTKPSANSPDPFKGSQTTIPSAKFTTSPDPFKGSQTTIPSANFGNSFSSFPTISDPFKPPISNIPAPYIPEQFKSFDNDFIVNHNKNFTTLNESIIKSKIIDELKNKIDDSGILIPATFKTLKTIYLAFKNKYKDTELRRDFIKILFEIDNYENILQEHFNYFEKDFKISSIFSYLIFKFYYFIFDAKDEKKYSSLSSYDKDLIERRTHNYKKNFYNIKNFILYYIFDDVIKSDGKEYSNIASYKSEYKRPKGRFNVVKNRLKNIYVFNFIKSYFNNYPDVSSHKNPYFINIKYLLDNNYKFIFIEDEKSEEFVLNIIDFITFSLFNADYDELQRKYLDDREMLKSILMNYFLNNNMYMLINTENYEDFLKTNIVENLFITKKYTLSDFTKLTNKIGFTKKKEYKNRESDISKNIINHKNKDIYKEVYDELVKKKQQSMPLITFGGGGTEIFISNVDNMKIILNKIDDKDVISSIYSHEIKNEKPLIEFYNLLIPNKIKNIASAYDSGSFMRGGEIATNILNQKPKKRGRKKGGMSGMPMQGMPMQMQGPMMGMPMPMQGMPMPMQGMSMPIQGMPMPIQGMPMPIQGQILEPVKGQILEPIQGQIVINKSSSPSTNVIEQGFNEKLGYDVVIYNGKPHRKIEGSTSVTYVPIREEEYNAPEPEPSYFPTSFAPQNTYLTQEPYNEEELFDYVWNYENRNLIRYNGYFKMTYDNSSEDIFINTNRYINRNINIKFFKYIIEKEDYIKRIVNEKNYNEEENFVTIVSINVSNNNKSIYVYSKENFNNLFLNNSSLHNKIIAKVSNTPVGGDYYIFFDILEDIFKNYISEHLEEQKNKDNFTYLKLHLKNVIEYYKMISVLPYFALYVYLEDILYDIKEISENGGDDSRIIDAYKKELDMRIIICKNIISISDNNINTIRKYLEILEYTLDNIEKISDKTEFANRIRNSCKNLIYRTRYYGKNFILD
jgi:hypothetical protein